jgi:hypothetical protein
MHFKIYNGGEITGDDKIHDGGGTTGNDKIHTPHDLT